MAYIPYSPITWNNDNPPPISETNLNRIEAGIAIIHRLTPAAQATPGMTLQVSSGIVFFTENPTYFAGGNSPTVTAPAVNPRIDLLVLNSTPALEWTTGTEAASPSPPSYPSDKIPICEIYNRVGETSIKNADDATNGYIYRDCRQYLNLGKDPGQGFKLLDGKTIELEEALGTDHTATGFIIDGATAGENLVFGNLVYLKSDGKFWKADADLAATTDGILAIALATIAANATGKMLLYGFARDDSWAWIVGQPLFVSSTAGAISSSPGIFSRKIGVAHTADIVHFNPDNIISEIEAPIGVEWNQATDTWRRIDESGNTVAAPPYGGTWLVYFNQHPIWGGMRRCTLADSGSVNHYGTNPRGDGLTKDGTDGQVMVEIPKCYVKSANPSANVYQWWFSPTARTGFVVDPAFKQRGGTERDYIYVGAYEANNDGGTPNKLRSITGAAVDNNKTIATFRTNAEARGSTRWGIMSIHVLSLIRRLFYVEYAGADSQTLIGRGRVDAASGLATGADSADTNIGVNGTGTGTGTNGLTPIVYRGIENLWGNYWQFIDGYNAVDAEYRIIKRDGTGTFQDTLAAGNYEASTAAPITTDGYQSNIFYEANQMALLLIPNAVAGASTSHLYDYFYAHNPAETNILLFGGHWDNAGAAGVAFLNSINVASLVGAYGGGRLEFV